ncbi:MAG: DUF4124 domain-containing protein [Burkholderiales bacterium]
MKRIRPRIVLSTAAAACALVLAPPILAATYKWVDENGKTVYGDKLPPEQVNKGSVQLDRNGVPIKRIDPAPTPEQRRAKAEEEAHQLELARERELLERRDRALLATYTTESEIDLARKRALATIDAQVQSSTAYTATLNKRKAELDRQVKALGDKPIGPALERELASVNGELQKQADLIALKQKEIVAVNAKYDADKVRWADLRARTAAMAAGQAPTKDASTKETPPLTPTTAKK